MYHQENRSVLKQYVGTIIYCHLILESNKHLLKAPGCRSGRAAWWPSHHQTGWASSCSSENPSSWTHTLPGCLWPEHTGTSWPVSPASDNAPSSSSTTNLFKKCVLILTLIYYFQNNLPSWFCLVWYCRLWAAAQSALAQYWPSFVSRVIPINCNFSGPVD